MERSEAPKGLPPRALCVLGQAYLYGVEHGDIRPTPAERETIARVDELAAIAVAAAQAKARA